MSPLGSKWIEFQIEWKIPLLFPPSRSNHCSMPIQINWIEVWSERKVLFALSLRRISSFDHHSIWMKPKFDRKIIFSFFSRDAKQRCIAFRSESNLNPNEYLFFLSSFDVAHFPNPNETKSSRSKKENFFSSVLSIGSSLRFGIWTKNSFFLLSSVSINVRSEFKLSRIATSVIFFLPFSLLDGDRYSISVG